MNRKAAIDGHWVVLNEVFSSLGFSPALLLS